MRRPMTRRDALAALGAGLLAGAAPAMSAAAGDPPLRLGATWRGAREGSTPYAGVLAFDREAGTLRIASSTPLPGRAHGLLAEADGSMLVVAVRPGHWLLRIDPRGDVVRRLVLTPGTGRHLTGHVVASADGRWLFTGETDPRDDTGWVAVRDRDSLEEIAAWPTHGIEPHEMVLDPHGALLVANGGILRTRQDRRRQIERMASSLVRLDSRSGALLGQWRLDDPRLSLRHMAWSDAAPGEPPLLGIALQAEHDAPERRREAPVLATWDGTRLAVPTHVADAVGYGGDIAAAPGGGFVISSHRVDGAFWWHPAEPGRLRRVARLTEAYALGSAGRVTGRGPGGATEDVAIACALGAALWHPTRPATLLPWPAPMALDNHWIALPSRPA